jgi:ribosome maturation factor RimP
MAAMTSSEVRPLLEPVVTAAGYDLEDVVVTAAGRRSVVRVVVDRDGGIDLDAVAEVARAVSEALDAADSLGSSPYVLEVTSPGVDRPLTLPRHWRRNVGRLVRVGELTGRIIDADEHGVTLQVAGDDEVLGYDDLGDGHVQVEFSRPGGGEPR